MNADELRTTVQHIVTDATALKNAHTNQKNAPVNYACVFSQGKKEYDELIETAQQIGVIKEHTKTGPLFQVKIETNSGLLQLLKIRIPDSTRPERGDADFTVSDFLAFKNTHLPKEGFKLIQKEGFVMIELADSQFDVRAYFSDPPLDKQLGIR